MKKLATVVQNISPSVTQNDAEPNMSLRGSINTDGKTTMNLSQLQTNPIIKDRKTYQSIRSLMQRVRPRYEYEWIVNNERRMEKRRLLLPILVSEEERAILEIVNLPASREILAAMVSRLMLGKQFHDGEKKAAFLVKEMVDWLEEQNAREWEAWSAVDELLCLHDSPFFPPLSALVRAFKKVRGND